MSEFSMALASCLLKVVFSIIGVIFTAVIIPWIKNTFIPWAQEKHIYGIVQTLVKAAEKQAEAGTIAKPDKKAYVIQILEGKGIEVTDEIDAFIEAAVKELDIAVSTAVVEIAGALEDSKAAESE